MFLFGGTITGGTAEDGGSIYVDSGAFFGMVGGTVKGGTSSKGCISNYGTMELSGGTVEGVFIFFSNFILFLNFT